MRPEFEKYSLIDDYLSGKLSATDARAFEENMASDPGFKEEVLDRKLTNEIIIENRFFDITTGIRTAPTGAKSLVSNSLKRFIGIGAAITVILLTPYYFSKRSEKTDQESAEANNSVATPVSPLQEESKETVLLEEQNPSADSIQDVVVEEEIVAEAAKEIPDDHTSKKSVKRSKKAKSVILEIPIDDPNAKTRSGNSYAFSLSKGQSWKIPSAQKEASLTIFDKTGNDVYNQALSSGKTFSWKGTATDGAKLKPGKYTYLLDFGHGNIEHGQVIINP